MKINCLVPSKRSLRFAAHAGLWALGFGLAVSPAHAQVSDTARLPDLVTTASRIATPANAIPAATTVLRGEDLRARGVTLVLDALREVPGLMVVQTGSYGAQASVFLRGGESNYVKVLLDGIPLNRAGGGVNFANLTVADLDRIEVVRGPASVVYGADAMSGVIQLFTRRASGHGSARVGARAGTYASSDLTAHVDVVAPKGWLLSVTGERQGSDGTYAFNNQYRNTMGSMQLGFDRGASGQAALTLRYASGAAHFPTDGGGAVVDHNQFTNEKSLAAGLNASWPVAGDGSLHVNAFASRLVEEYTNRSDAPADTIGFHYVDDRAGTAWRRGVDVRLDRRNNGAIVSLGAGIERETLDDHDIGISNFGFGAGTDTSAFNGGRTTRNAFLQLLSEPGAKVSAQAGVRLDHNTAFGTFRTWRVGASWHLSERARFWAATGTAFKAPTFAQLFASSAFEVGNPDLKPERSHNTEFGLETRTENRRTLLGVTAFWQQFRDLIQYTFGAPGEPNYVNLGGVNNRGIEVVVSTELAPALSFDAHWTWLHTEVTDTGTASSLAFQQGGTLIRRPASSGGATLRLRQRGVTLAATATHVGSRDDVDFSGYPGTRVILPAYTTVDLGATVPVLRGGMRAPGLDISARAENLFNVAWQQAVGFPGRGRTLLVGAGLRF